MLLNVALGSYICGADRKSGMHEKLYPLEMTAATACLKLSQALFSNFISIIFDKCKNLLLYDF